MWLQEHTNFFSEPTLTNMVWYKPWTWFSNTAKNIKQNTNSSTLKNALTNYVKAVNDLNNKSNARIYGVMMQKKNGTNATYKNRIINGVAKIVIASRGAIPKAAEAAAGEAPVGPAVEAVNNATRKVKELNNFMATLQGTANEQNTAYFKAKRNPVNNKATNAGRTNGAPRYQNTFNRLINFKKQTSGMELNDYIGSLQGNNAAKVATYIGSGRNLAKNRTTNANRKGGAAAKHANFFKAVNQAILNQKINNLRKKAPAGAQLSRNNLARLYLTTYPNNLNKNRGLNTAGKHSILFSVINQIIKEEAQKKQINVSTQPLSEIAKQLRAIVVNTPPANLTNNSKRINRANSALKQKYNGKYLEDIGSEPNWNAAFNRLMRSPELNTDEKKNLLKRIYFAYKKLPINPSRTNRAKLTERLAGVNNWNTFKARYPNSPKF